MTDAPTLIHVAELEPLDLAVIDGTDVDTELVPDDATVIESMPVPELPTPITPSTQADRIASAITQWLADIERLPGLNARLESIQEQTHAAYREYSAGISEVNKRFADSLRPLDIERKELESQVAVAESARKRLDELAAAIQAPTTTTKG
jgi:hypothetical protein